MNKISKNDTIKILFISHSSNMYGSEKSLLILLQQINYQKFSPIVILPNKGPLECEINNLGIKNYLVSVPIWFHGYHKNFLSTIKSFFSNFIR